LPLAAGRGRSREPQPAAGCGGGCGRGEGGAGAGAAPPGAPRAGRGSRGANQIRGAAPVHAEGTLPRTHASSRHHPPVDCTGGGMAPPAQAHFAAAFALNARQVLALVPPVLSMHVLCPCRRASSTQDPAGSMAPIREAHRLSGNEGVMVWGMRGRSHGGRQRRGERPTDSWTKRTGPCECVPSLAVWGVCRQAFSTPTSDVQ
jgi:hypothetical protein